MDNLNNWSDISPPHRLFNIATFFFHRYWTNNATQQHSTAGHNQEANARAVIIDGIVSSYNSPVGKYNKKAKGHNFNSTRSGWPRDSLFRLNAREKHKLQIQKTRFQSKGNLHRVRPPRDCKIGDWSPWSACSRTCGVGETQRVGKIIIKARRGGKPCHSITETKWCGSATPCPDSHKSTDNFFLN